MKQSIFSVNKLAMLKKAAAPLAMTVVIGSAGLAPLTASALTITRTLGYPHIAAYCNAGQPNIWYLSGYTCRVRNFGSTFNPDMNSVCSWTYGQGAYFKNGKCLKDYKIGVGIF